MPYATADARQQLIDTIATAGERIGAALALTGAAYELLDEGTGDRLEKAMFQPLQAAYGRARRAQLEFAGRHDLIAPEIPPGGQAAPAPGAQRLLEEALDEAAEADQQLADLQDTLLPVEVGDAELRADLERVRSLLGDIPGRARELLRTLGR